MTANALNRIPRLGLAAAALILAGVGTAQAEEIIVGDSDANIYSVDVSNGTATKLFTTKVSDTVTAMRDIAYVGATLYGVDKTNLYQIDNAGNATVVGTLNAGTTPDPSKGMNGLFYDGTTLYGMSNGTTDLYKIATTGVSNLATSVGDTGRMSAGDIEQDMSDSGRLLATVVPLSSEGDSASRLVSIAKSNADTSVIGSTGADIVWGLAYAGSTLYGAAGSGLYSFNTTNGLATFLYTIFIGGDQNEPISVAFGATRTVVPLPAAVWLFGSASAMLGLVGVGNRRKQKLAA